MPAPRARYRFDIRLHHRPTAACVGGLTQSPNGPIATLQVPEGSQAEPMSISFDAALSEISLLTGSYVEPDGSILWTGSDAEGRWQVDGNLFERGERVVFSTLSGICPAEEFDKLLACFGWPHEPLMMELVRAAVFVSEEVFREVAALPEDLPRR